MSAPTRAAILEEAAGLICGDRQQTYGPPQKNFQRIADGWNWWLASTGRPGVAISPQDVAMMMGLLKMARVAEGPTSRDGYRDLAGYVGIAGELAGAEDEIEVARRLQGLDSAGVNHDPATGEVKR